MTVSALLSLMTVLVLATCDDLASHRISNAIVASGLLLGLFTQCAANGGFGLIHGLSGMAVGLAFLLPFYLLRVMGAGDVKLMAAAGTFLGPSLAIAAGLSTLIVGGVLGAALIAGHYIKRFVQARSPRYATLTELDLVAQPVVNIRKQRFPYAIAIALGTVVALAFNGQFDPLATIFGKG